MLKAQKKRKKKAMQHEIELARKTEDSKKLVYENTTVTTKMKKSVGLVFSGEGKLLSSSFRKSSLRTFLHAFTKRRNYGWTAVTVHRCRWGTRPCFLTGKWRLGSFKGIKKLKNFKSSGSQEFYSLKTPKGSAGVRSLGKSNHGA